MKNANLLWTRIRTGGAVLVMAFFLVSCEGLPKISPSELASIVQANEDKVQSVHAEGEELYWPEAGAANESPDAQAMQTELVWAFKSPVGTKQYSSIMGEIPWYDGEAPSVAGGCRIAWNGEIGTYDQEQFFPKTGAFIREGLIESSADRSTESFGSSVLGRTTFWRYGKRLSDAIRNECSLCEPDVIEESFVYRIELPLPDGRETLWIDPSRGCAIVRLRNDANGCEQKVTLQEVIPSVWFPKHILQTVGKTRTEIKLTKVQVNQPMSDDMFILKFKTGTIVTDTRTDKVFIVKEQANVSDKSPDHVGQVQGAGNPKATESEGAHLQAR